MTITVTGSNDAPVAVDDAVSVAEDTVFTSTVDLDFNDSDVDGDALSGVAGSFATAQGGTLVLAADGSYSYTPAADFNGIDTVTYTVTDGALTDTATLTITVGATSTPELPTVTIPVDTGDPTDPPPDPADEDSEAPVDPEETPVEDVEETVAPPPNPAAEDPLQNRRPAKPGFAFRGDADRPFTSFRMAALNFQDIAARLSGVYRAEQPVDAADPGSQEVERQVRVHNLMSARVYLNMLQTLNEVKQEMVGDIAFNQTVLGSAIVMSTGLSVGYVVWLVRGGMLLSSLLSSLPAWQILDPLPILARRKDGEDSDDEESLESILANKPKPPDPKAIPEDGSEGAKRQSD